jgi:hypothetical protein
MEEDTGITIMDVDRLPRLLRLREGILIRPLPRNNRHQHLPAAIQMETDTYLFRLRLSNSRDSTQEATSTQGILHHLPIRGRALVAEPQAHREAHNQLDLAAGAGVHPKEAGSNQDKQAAMEEVKTLRIVVAVRLPIRLREVTVRL